MLLLANMDQYQDCLARAAAMHQGAPFDAEAMEAYRDKDMNKYAILGTDAVIEISGPLAYKADYWSYYMGGISYQGLQNKLKDAVANDAVSRIILLMDTPGGEVTGLPETARMIRECSKPVITMIDPCCASAGLWLASQSSKVVSVESGEIGSLGVQCVAVSYAEAYKKAGYDIRVIRASVSPEKNIAHPYEPLSEKAEAYLQSRVDAKGQQFVDTVAKGRNVSRDVVLEKFGQGRMLDSAEALSVGLIDEVGTLEGLLSSGRKAVTTSGKRRASSVRYDSMKFGR